jgi:hypothetical protein
MHPVLLYGRPRRGAYVQSDHCGFHPIRVTCANTNELLAIKLRPASI